MDCYFEGCTRINLSYFAKESTIPRSDISDHTFNGVPLNCFSCVTLQEIRHTILKAPSKSCELDPLPSWLLKDCVDELSPIVTCIVKET